MKIKSSKYLVSVFFSLLLIALVFAATSFSFAEEEQIPEQEAELEQAVESENEPEIELVQVAELENEQGADEQTAERETEQEDEPEQTAEQETEQETVPEQDVAPIEELAPEQESAPGNASEPAINPDEVIENEIVSLDESMQATNESQGADSALMNGWSEDGRSYYIGGEAQKGFVTIGDEKYYFDSNGKLLGVTTVLQDTDGDYYFVNNGKVDYSYVGLVKSVSNYYFVRNGKLDYSYTGLAMNIDDGLLHYVENGKQSNKRTGINKSIHDDQYYFVKRGVFDPSYTGLAVSEKNYYYVENGKLNREYSGIARNRDDNKHYYAKDGRVDKSFTGIAKSTTHYYFCRKGVLDRTYTGLALNVDDGKLHYVKKGMQKNNRTGINKSVHDKEFYFVRNGVEDPSYSGLALSVSKWYYVQDGKLDLSYSGPAASTKTRRWYHVESGRWAKKKNGKVELSDNSYTVKKGVIVDSSINVGSKKYYLDNDGVKRTLQGIDVSRWQGTIDWDEVKNDGIEFAFVRVGGRGVQTASLFEDIHYQRNLSEANRVGIKVGVYFFTAATNEEEGREEAAYACDLIEGYDVYYPVVIDTEWGYIKENGKVVEEGRHNPSKLSVEDRTAAIRGFCDEVKARGYKPMIYSSTWWYNNCLNMDELSDVAIWCAHWNVPECKYQGDVSVWQYSSEGVVKGITENVVDMNIMYYEPI